MTNGRVIYPNRPDLANRKFWVCDDCKARVGCHPGTEIPLGNLADAETRMWRVRAHETFDWLWKTANQPSETRSKLYRWLASKMQLTAEECHIGKFDIKQCKSVQRLVNDNKEVILNDKHEVCRNHSD